MFILNKHSKFWEHLFIFEGVSGFYLKTKKIKAKKLTLSQS